MPLRKRGRNLNVALAILPCAELAKTSRRYNQQEGTDIEKTALRFGRPLPDPGIDGATGQRRCTLGSRLCGRTYWPSITTNTSRVRPTTQPIAARTSSRYSPNMARMKLAPLHSSAWSRTIDAPCGVVSMHVKARMDRAGLGRVDTDEAVDPCLHPAGAPLAWGQTNVSLPCTRTKFICQCPKSREVWSFGDGYNGSALQHGSLVHSLASPGLRKAFCSLMESNRRPDALSSEYVKSHFRQSIFDLYNAPAPGQRLALSRSFSSDHLVPSLICIIGAQAFRWYYSASLRVQHILNVALGSN